MKKTPWPKCREAIEILIIFILDERLLVPEKKVGPR